MVKYIEATIDVLILYVIRLSLNYSICSSCSIVYVAEEKNSFIFSSFVQQLHFMENVTTCIDFSFKYDKIKCSLKIKLNSKKKSTKVLVKSFHVYRFLFIQNMTVFKYILLPLRLTLKEDVKMEQ